MKKRLLATLLSLCMVIGLLPTVAFAADLSTDPEDIFSYTVTDDKVTITKFDPDYLSNLENKTDIALVIPATIDNKPVVAIGNYAFAYGSYTGTSGLSSDYVITSLTFEEDSNIKTIGNGVFYAIAATGDLTLPDSIESIGTDAFNRSAFEGTLTLPNNANYTEILSQTFYYVTFTNVIWPVDGTGTTQITTIGNNALNSVQVTGDVVIPEGVTTLGTNFYNQMNGTTSFSSLELPSTITSVDEYSFRYIKDAYVKANFDFTNLTITGSNYGKHYMSNDCTFIVKSYEDYSAATENAHTSSGIDNFTYELTLKFDGLDSTYDRDVLYNRAINLQENGNGITWSADASYTLPAVGAKEQWSFTNETEDGTNPVTESTLVTGETLYKVTVHVPQDDYEYYEFGTYKQTQFIDSTNDTDSDLYKNAIATIEAAEAEGREFYVYETTNWIYWFEYEPILWRNLGYSGEDLYLLSEYILDFGVMHSEYNLYSLETSTLYQRLQTEFIPEAFTDTEQEDFNVSITLPSTSILNNTEIFPSDDYRKATRTDYTNYIGSYNAYWTSYVWGEYNESYSMYTRYVNASGGFSDYLNQTQYGVRPMMIFTPDTTKYTTTGTGTFDDPYKFALIETVASTLSDGVTLTKDEQFELSFSDGATIYYKINDGETQTYDPEKLYYISQSCTLTAWAEVDGITSEEISWTYKVEKTAATTTETTLDLSNFDENAQIIKGVTNSTPDNFDVIVVPEIEDSEQTSLEEAMPSGYEYADGFHLYATVNGEIIEDATFTNTVNITLTNELDSTKTYQLLHLKDGYAVDTFSEEDGTLTVNSEDNSISFEFDVSKLSPFMLVSKMSTSSGSSNVGTLIDPDASSTTAETTETTEDDDDLPFIDVDDADYYYDAVAWAVEQGITTGTTSTGFSPDSPASRGQVVTFLYRAFGEPETDGENTFDDVDEDSYYGDAVKWALELGITAGMADGIFGTEETCTRAQIITFLWRAAGSPEVEGSHDFTDVEAGSYYEMALLWAVENGITNGMGDGTFGVDEPCTRAQIVTFLYRYFG